MNGTGAAIVRGQINLRCIWLFRGKLPDTRILVSGLINHRERFGRECNIVPAKSSGQCKRRAVTEPRRGNSFLSVFLYSFNRETLDNTNGVRSIDLTQIDCLPQFALDTLYRSVHGERRSEGISRSHRFFATVIVTRSRAIEHNFSLPTSTRETRTIDGKHRRVCATRQCHCSRETTTYLIYTR